MNLLFKRIVKVFNFSLYTLRLISIQSFESLNIPADMVPYSAFLGRLTRSWILQSKQSYNQTDDQKM